MAIRSLAVVGLLIIIFQPWSAIVAHADDASVLPKGRSSVSLENLFYFATESRWNPHGNPEKVADVFNERLVTLADFGLGPSAAIIGTAFLKFNYDFNILDFAVAHGVTDRLTVGVDIPYYWAQNRPVKALLSSAGANVGLATGPGAGPPPCLAPLVRPLGCPSTRAFTTEDVQQLLGPGLAGIPGFGFKRIENFSANGVGDITAGAKYQYFRNEDFRLAATAGVRFPTGRQDDPDNLADVAWSSGAYALLLRLHNDYVLSNLWKGKPAAESMLPQPGDLIFDFTFRYDLVLPDKATLRVADPSNPITRNRERFHRDLGDRFELEWTAKYHTPLPGLSVSALYKYGFKLKDRITGKPGFRTQFVEKDTDSTEQIFIVRGTYSTLPWYRAGWFPIPANISLGYRDRFAGSGPRNAASPSQFLKTRYISLGLEVLF